MYIVHLIYIGHFKFKMTFKLNTTGPNFIINTLPSVFILIIADQILEYLLCSYKYN